MSELKNFNVRLPVDTHRKILELVKLDGRTVQEYIKRLIDREYADKKIGPQ